eukprot:scaffold39600_cov46-Cyclotella_meneghiniana.AAC.5
MSVEEIWVSKLEYDQYLLFKKYLNDLKERVDIEKRCVIEDDENAKMFYVNNPSGYPHWDTSKARDLLKKDAENKLHKKMIMKQMQKKRKENMVFPAEVFARRLCGFWFTWKKPKGNDKAFQTSFGQQIEELQLF